MTLCRTYKRRCWQPHHLGVEVLDVSNEVLNVFIVSFVSQLQVSKWDFIDPVWNLDPFDASKLSPYLNPDALNMVCCDFQNLLPFEENVFHKPFVVGDVKCLKRLFRSM